MIPTPSILRLAERRRATLRNRPRVPPMRASVGSPLGEGAVMPPSGT